MQSPVTIAKGGTSTPFVENLQVLRFVAAFMVLLSHARHETAASAGAFAPAFHTPFDLVTGVDIFFVISGFVMFYLCHDRFGRPGEPTRFLQRRAIRLIPTYWVFTALMILAAYVFRGQLAKADISMSHLLASLAFIPWPDQSGEMFPPLMLGWTLNYEAMFYVMFAGALMMPKRAGVAALIGIFVLAAAFHHAIPEKMRMLRFWFDPIILEFLMGIGLAALFLNGRRLSLLAGLCVSLAGFALLSLFYGLDWQPQPWRFVWGGVPALMICAGLALSEHDARHSRIYRFVVLCGSASYALYLSHLFTVKFIGVFWRKLSLGMPWLMLAVTCAASVAISLCVYVFMEKPLMALLSRLFDTKAAVPDAPDRDDRLVKGSPSERPAF